MGNPNNRVERIAGYHEPHRGAPVARVFLAAAGLLIGSMVFTYWMGHLVLAANGRLVTQRRIIDQLDQVILTMVDAETGHRGYLLTGEVRYLEPYNKSLGKIQNQLDGLHRLASMGDLPAKSVALVISLVYEKLDVMAGTNQLRREKGLELALGAMRTDRGRRIMCALRSVVSGMRVGEVLEFEQASVRTKMLTTVRTIVLILTVLVSLTFLAWAYRRISRDITERKRAQEELRKARDELELRVHERTVQLQDMVEELKRSNRDLEQFAYVSSHDLKEPLRMVANYTRLLERNYKDKLDDDARTFIDFAVEGAMRMERLVNDLLEYSRVTGQGKPFASTNLEQVLGHVLANLKARIEETKAQITHEPLPTLMANETQLGQVWQNLIGNALKFHKPDRTPCIHIGVERREHDWLFFIRDNGIGIDPQYYEKIFTIFKRLHTRRHYEGNGIGLAVVKRIVERHKGQVWVDSTPDLGSTFSFTLPLGVSVSLC